MMAAVHTTGVNWQSVGTIIGAVTAVLGLIGGWINRTIERHRKDTKAQITEIAGSLATRLDTFDRHLSKQDDDLHNVSERVARLEGPLERAATAVKAATNAG